MSASTVSKAMLNAIKQRLDATGLTDAVAWPNKTFTPSTSLWCSVTVWPGKPEPATLGATGEDEVIGFAQVNVSVPTDTGDAAQDVVLSALEAWFVGGRTVSYSGQSVTIKNAERAPGMTLDPYWTVPLTIYFSARYSRPALA